MRTFGIVVDAPGFDQPAGFGERREHVLVQAFVSLPLKLSMKPFCCGFPGAM